MLPENKTEIAPPQPAAETPKAVIKHLTDADFREAIKTGLVLVDFWAEWCAPCRRLAPAVDAIAEQYQGRLTVAKMNIDENPFTGPSFQVRGIPTLLLFKNGELKESIVGLVGKDELSRMIDTHLA